jgi:hypothetical protein
MSIVNIEHESSVNYKNLKKNLADMYPYTIEDVILSELIANLLDSNPSKIIINYT